MSDSPRPPKRISRSASLDALTDNRDTLAASLAHHVTRLASELIAKRHVTSRLRVFLILEPSDKRVWEARFHPPTASYFRLSQAARDALDQLYRPEQLYRGCGVVAAEIAPAASVAPDLFGAADGDEHQDELLGTVVSINCKSGKITTQAALPAKEEQARTRFQLPLFEVD